MYYRRWFYVIFILISFLLSFSLYAQDFEGKVVSIADGDTISVMHNGTPEKIRLNGIDCPERGQAFGNRAKQFTGDMVFGKTVTIKGKGKDKYGRTIGDVFLLDGTCLNKELVKQGLAWWYRQYSNDKEIEQLEQTARSSKQGLWSDPKPTAPWDYRHNRASSSNSSKASSSTVRSPLKAANDSSSETEKALPESSTSPVVTGTPTGETTPGGFEIYEGPRGGQYHYSKDGNKVYEKRRK